MEELASSPGMVALLAFIAVVQGLSLVLMLLNVHEFRKQKEKYLSLLRGLGDERAIGTPGRFLLPIYLATTIGITFVTLYLFIVQPHFL